MRIVREYFGLDRSTVVYDNEITGVGGNPDEFSVVAEIGTVGGNSWARTTVKFSHHEMSRMLAEYRRHYPIDGISHPLLIGRPRFGGILRKIGHRFSAVFEWCRRARRQSDSNKYRDGA